MAHPEHPERRDPHAAGPPTGSAVPAPQPQTPQPQALRVPGPFEIMVRTSAAWGLTAAVIVFGLFAVVPLLHPLSGAAGAFAATFFIVLGQRFGGRRRK
jgi:hypothetical protein